MKETIIKLKNINISDVDCYRANTGYVTVYYKNGNVFRVNETFKQVDDFLTTTTKILNK